MVPQPDRVDYAAFGVVEADGAEANAVASALVLLVVFWCGLVWLGGVDQDADVHGAVG